VVHITAVDTRPDRTLVRLVSTQELLEQLLSNVDVERVRAPLRAVVTLGDVVTAAMPASTSAPAQTPIGVIDGVINMLNPLTGPQVLSTENFPHGHVFANADAHGTAVAGTAVWGDLDPLVTSGTLPTPHPIISARVLDLDPSGDYTVTGLAHLTIEQAIRWLVTEHAVRVINLSINQPVPASGALRDELTVTIDTLARELDVVIVVSTGNRTHLASGNWLADYPAYLNDADARIAAPGDAALAVTVGSHAQRDVPGGQHATAKVAIAATGQPSPFTRTGPTRGISHTGTLKPEFTHHAATGPGTTSPPQSTPANPARRPLSRSRRKPAGSWAATAAPATPPPPSPTRSPRSANATLPPAPTCSARSPRCPHGQCQTRRPSTPPTPPATVDPTPPECSKAPRTGYFSPSKGRCPPTASSCTGSPSRRSSPTESGNGPSASP